MTSTFSLGQLGHGYNPRLERLVEVGSSVPEVALHLLAKCHVSLPDGRSEMPESRSATAQRLQLGAPFCEPERFPSKNANRETDLERPFCQRSHRSNANP